SEEAEIIELTSTYFKQILMNSFIHKRDEAISGGPFFYHEIDSLKRMFAEFEKNSKTDNAINKIVQVIKNLNPYILFLRSSLISIFSFISQNNPYDNVEDRSF